MKLILALVSLTILSGCANINYSRINPDGSQTKARANSWFSGTAIKGFNADSSTPAGTKTGLKFTSSDSSPDSEAIGAVVGAAVGAALRERERSK